MLIFTLANERQRKQIHHAEGPIEFGSPSLRTVQADLPHTALRSVVHPVKD